MKKFKGYEIAPDDHVIVLHKDAVIDVNGNLAMICNKLFGGLSIKQAKQVNDTCVYYRPINWKTNVKSTKSGKVTAIQDAVYAVAKYQSVLVSENTHLQVVNDETVICREHGVFFRRELADKLAKNLTKNSSGYYFVVTLPTADVRFKKIDKQYVVKEKI
jgi:hypothetical protein